MDARPRALRSVLARGALVLGALGFVAAAWLLVPRDRAGAALLAPVRAVLVDASASVRRQRPDWLRWARQELESQARAATEGGEELFVVVFASDVRAAFGPDRPQALVDALYGRGGRPFDPAAGAGDDRASRLADAVAVAAPFVAAPGRAPGALVLLGDGEYDGEDPRAALGALAARGVALAWTRPPAAALGDLALVDLTLSTEVEAGAPLGGVLRLAWRPGAGEARARLAIETTSGGQESFRVARALALPDEEAQWELALDCGTAGFGRTEVTVRAELLSGTDPVPENDVRRAATKARGALVVGVVSDAADEERARLWAVPSGVSSLPGVQFVFLRPQALPRALEELDAVVTFDVPLTRLPGRALEDWVRAGGGWLALSGWRALEAWSPGQAAEGLFGLLPLEPAPLEQEPRDVVLLVDGSGSMEGPPFETVRAACVELVRAALPSDRVALRFFTTGLERELVLRERGSAVPGDDVARRLLAARVPLGQTLILRSLEQFAAERAGASTQCLAFLLSDGRERDVLADPLASAREVAARLRREGTRLAVVAVGGDPDTEFLSGLVPPGEEPARGESLADLASVFRREISGARWREAEALPVVPVAAPAELAREALGSALDPAEPLPPLARLVKDRARPGAAVVWTSEDGEPVLALARAGLGRTALFASLPDSDWAPAWTGRFGLGEPARFGPLLRWLARATRRPPQAALRVTLRDGRLRLEGVPPEAPARLAGRLVDPLASAAEEGALSALPVLLDPPARFGAGALGRREAPLPAALGAAPAGSVRALLLERTAGFGAGAEGEEGELLWAGILALDLPAELGPSRARLSARAFAAPPGGVLTGPGGPAGGALPRPHPAAPAVLGAALALCFAGALARRG